MKIDSWAVSDVPLLSSTAREYAMKSFPFPISCCCRSIARSHTQSATVFLLRLTFKNACLLSGHTMSQTCIIQFLTNSPSLCDLTFTNSLLTPAFFSTPLHPGASVSCPDVLLVLVFC